jgi:hypothetical protein
MSKAYPSNLTLDRFELISPLLPTAKPGGRDRLINIYLYLNRVRHAFP